MRDLLLGLGVLAVVEGLVLVVLPMRLEDIVSALQRMSRDQRRMIGLVIIAIGAVFIWLAKEFL